MKPNFSSIKNFREFFLFLLPLFFVFHGFVAYYHFIPIKDGLSLFGYYTAFALLFSLLIYFIFRSWRKAALFTFCLFSFHFFFGSWHDASKEAFGSIFFNRYSFIIPFFFALFLFLFFAIKKSKRKFDRTTKYLNILLFVFLLWDVVVLVQKINKRSHDSELVVTKSICDTCSKPDVYLIIADEYASSRELKEVFHFRNDSFENALTQRGFYAVSSPQSNYNSTPFSVSSILNFSYLPLKNPNHSMNDYGTILEMIRNNKVQQALNGLGYQSVNNSFFDLQGLPSQVEESLLPAKTKYITGQTFISRIMRDIMFNLVTKFKFKWAVKNDIYKSRGANQLLYNRTLQSISLASPKFSYTHLMLPHPPFYYDENCNENPLRIVTNETNKEAYVNYVQYANKKYLYLIAQILTKSAKPPIIILMSDHGFRGMTLNNRTYDFDNIIYLYLPSKKYAPYYQGMSNVNLFRLLLNNEFGQQYPLLKDSTISLKD